MTKILYIGNLNYHTTEGRIRTLFAEAGKVNSVALITDRTTGANKGFGFVEMATDQEKNEAISRLDGYNVDERPIKVNVARGRESTGHS